MTKTRCQVSSLPKQEQHNGTPTFVCPCCHSKTFVTDDKFQRHVQIYHEPSLRLISVDPESSPELYVKLVREEAKYQTNQLSSSTHSTPLSTRSKSRQVTKQLDRLILDDSSATTDVNLDKTHIVNEVSDDTTPDPFPPLNGDSIFPSHESKAGRCRALEGDADDRNSELLLQPDSRPISQSQLAAEVKSIYAGLVMVENKCISIDKAQAAAVLELDRSQLPPLADDHWQALIALHRTLLHEHHDFFLASQHPSATPALQRLALKYSMPARMWKHGIHSFLELLRRRLPESLDYMLSFIYLAYQMVALLFETVPAFEETWIECLGDLGRYRMAIEDEDMRDRETWAGVARFWYSKAADKNPTVGRLYHHLAILARPNALQQLFYYTRSLACIQPFMSARESILTLLDPVLGHTRTRYSHACEIDTAFIKLHGLLFKREELQSFRHTTDNYLYQLDGHIGRVNSKWRDQGVFIAVTNISSLFDYGQEDSALRKFFNLRWKRQIETLTRPQGASGSESGLGTPAPPKKESAEVSLPSLDSVVSSLASHITFDTFRLALRRIGDQNTLPHIHCLLVFLLNLSSIPHDCSIILERVPWEDLPDFLNALANAESVESFPQEDFPTQSKRPLPEDFSIRGQIWSLDYFPSTWFESEIDGEERNKELASTNSSRIERLLWLGIRLAQRTKWLRFNHNQKFWSLNSELIKADSATTYATDCHGSTHEPIEHGVLSKHTTPFKKAIARNYTAIMCESAMLLWHTEVFIMLLDSGNWKVLILKEVIGELHSHVARHGKKTTQAEQVLTIISTAISTHKNLEVVDENGCAVLNATELLSAKWTSTSKPESRDKMEAIINVAQGINGPLPHDQGGGQIVPGAKPAVLVSESSSTRLKARRQGLTSVSISMIRRLLSSQRDRHESPSNK